MIAPRVEDFTDAMQPIADVLGVQAAQRLVAHFGGARVYVPRVWRADLDLNVIGEDVAQALCARFGAEKIDIPKNPYTVDALRRFVAEARAAGRSGGQIARALGVSWRTVTRLSHGCNTTALRRARRIDARQVDLVDWLDHSDRS